MRNPFITNGYAGNRYFCDRIDETRTIVEMLTNDNNIAVISPRRVGKTELIKHCFSQKAITDNYNTFIIDIYATTSLSDFINVFGKAIVEALRPKGRAVWEKFVQILTSFKSEISFDMNGLPVWNTSVGAIANPQLTLDEIFTYLDNADKPCLIAIDEFQQITSYADRNIEATLRTYVQRCTNAHFIFSGSQRHLMGAMFTSPSRPFYQSVNIINLPIIPMDKYVEFAMDKFTEAGKNLAPDVVPILYEKFDGVTSYLQKVMNVLWSRTDAGTTCTSDSVDEAIDYLLGLSSETYESLLYQMPEKQKMVFMAIASEGRSRNVTSGKFVSKYHLVSASSVSSAVRGLVDKDFITLEKDEYVVYDKMFALWLRNRGFV